MESSDLRFAGRLVTPPFAPTRFDTAFFVADLPPGQQAEVWPGELTEGSFASAAAALARWQQGDYPLSPPTVSMLEVIRGRPVEELPSRIRGTLDVLDSGRLPAIWFSPGVLMIPLDCRGYPPTTHTNTFLIGTGPRYLVDPGASDSAEQEKLFEAVAGRSIDAVVLTHHHPDHVGAAMVSARRFGVPILAHPITAQLLRGKVAVDQLIEDGDRLDLGEAPHGRGAGRWRRSTRRATPRAIWPSGSRIIACSSSRTCFQRCRRWSSRRKTAISASTSIRYAGCKRFPRACCCPRTDRQPCAAHVLEEALAHRAAREQQLIEAITPAPRTIDELVLAMYRGFSGGVLKLAALSIHAGLIKLQREGRVVEEAGRWRLVA